MARPCFLLMVNPANAKLGSSRFSLSADGVEYSNQAPLLINQAALTNRSHHTLTTQLFPNNTPMLIHINGDNGIVSNNRMLSATKLKHQRFKLLLQF